MKRSRESSGRSPPQAYKIVAKKVRQDGVPTTGHGHLNAPTRQPKAISRTFPKPKFHDVVSQKLSEVLKDMGVNVDIVRRRRRSILLDETITTAVAEDFSAYKFGSLSEGTTTLGMGSDLDSLNCSRRIIVTQSVKDWNPAFTTNLLIKQDDHSPPGYCRLLLFSDDGPSLADQIPNPNFDIDRQGHIVMTNTVIRPGDPIVTSFGLERHGPSMARLNRPHGSRDNDIVFALHCPSWRPNRKWTYNKEAFASDLTPDLCHQDACNAGCFLVSVGSKRSSQEPVEWRISTAVIERSLMFGLDITHLHCYTLMKFILKTFIEPVFVDTISSFICKTTLLHCVNRAPVSAWREGNLLSCLSFCLSTLKIFISCNNCPHFVVTYNNLLAGRLTSQTQRRLLDILNNLLDDDWRFLLKISFDDLGHNLGIKLSKIPEVGHFDVSKQIERNICNYLVIDIAQFLSETELMVLNDVSANDRDGTIQNLISVLDKLSVRCYHGNRTERKDIQLFMERLYTYMGSLIASRDIEQKLPISQEAITFFERGYNSDVTSGRLKLASAYFCVGEFENAKRILAEVENRYDLETIEPFCQCYDNRRFISRPGFFKVCRRSTEQAIKMASAFCVRFTEHERYCVPMELRYEYERCSNTQYMFHTDSDHEDTWMKWAMVDALPFLHFLRLKVYHQLDKPEIKGETLKKFTSCLGKEINFNHSETGWNLLGLVMELESEYLHAAEKCYNASLDKRRMCNAANEHLQRLEMKWLQM